MTDIDPAAARVLIDAGAFLLDVREDDEWNAGHAPEAVHVAMGSVADRIDEIPADRTVVCVCRVGGRSGAVAAPWPGPGYDVRNVDGGHAGLGGGRLPVVSGSGGGPGRIV